MKKIIFILMMSLLLISCSATSSRIDSTYSSKLNIVSAKNDEAISKVIFKTANEHGYRQRTLDLKTGYFQYMTPRSFSHFSMEVTIFIEPISDSMNRISISAMPYDRDRMSLITKHMVEETIEDFLDDLYFRLAIR